MEVQPKYSEYSRAPLFRGGVLRQPPDWRRRTRRSGARRRCAEQAAADGRVVGPRPSAVRHFLLALPRRRWRWQRHHRPARHAASDQLSRRPVADGGRPAFLRRHHQRLRRDVFLRLARAAARPLGDRRLYPGVAVEPPRVDRRCAARPARQPDGCAMRLRPGIALLVVSALVLVAGLVVDIHSTLAAYLVAWIALGSIPIGALGILMMTYLVRWNWTAALRPVLMAAIAALPLVALLFVPDPDLDGACLSGRIGSGVAAAVQGGLSGAVVLRASHHRLFRDLVVAGAVAAPGRNNQRANDTRGFRRADRLCADGFAGRGGLAGIART